ncbi:MAG TPA: NAD(P)H-dependent glycerol-3-phosphate dehydrogenase [Thermodesulfovibrionia bacterium]|nr:NAD(P)H-dependent glycerol-3-phosphate dehydrogenase [Thermodesulfovibrionia bacterium]
MPNISVFGGGSWGTTLAVLLANKGFPVRLWVYEKELARQIQTSRENKLYLPGVTIPGSAMVTDSLEEAVMTGTILLSVIPTQYVRSVFSSCKDLVKTGHVVVSCSKGIEKGTLLTPAGVLKDVFGEGVSYAVLSGPSFAAEVAKNQPTAVTLAAQDKDLAMRLQRLFNTNYFRVYTNYDIVGVELGGAVKNVIALASGITDGLGLGNNTRAALISRGLAEMVRLGATMGARAETFSGLSGLGDLILTCTGALSRNRSVGVKLGQGKLLKDIIAEMKGIAEGVESTMSVRDLAWRQMVEMPIVEQVYHVLYRNKSPKEAVNHLMTRAYKDEFER